MNENFGGRIIFEVAKNAIKPNQLIGYIVEHSKQNSGCWLMKERGGMKMINDRLIRMLIWLSMLLPGNKVWFLN